MIIQHNTAGQAAILLPQTLQCTCPPPGEFGIVYRAQLTGWEGMNEVVAVKTMRGGEQAYT